MALQEAPYIKITFIHSMLQRSNTASPSAKQCAALFHDNISLSTCGTSWTVHCEYTTNSPSRHTFHTQYQHSQSQTANKQMPGQQTFTHASPTPTCNITLKGKKCLSHRTCQYLTNASIHSLHTCATVVDISHVLAPPVQQLSVYHK
jgi:hypothetical protein